MNPHQDGPLIFSREYYDTLYALENAHWWTQGMNDINNRVLASRLSDKKQLSAIDVGCGSGTGLAWMNYHLDTQFLVGLDISRFGIQYCQDRADSLIIGSASEIPVNSNCFDLIICNDLLQHVEDDEAVVREAFRILKPGGLFFARTNGRFIVPRNPGCLRLYTKSGLGRMVKNPGFGILLLSPANMLGSSFAALKYLVSRVLRLKPHRSKEVNNGHTDDDTKVDSPEKGGLQLAPITGSRQRLIYKVMRGFLNIEGMIMKYAPWLILFGHSHIVLARKPFGAKS